MKEITAERDVPGQPIRVVRDGMALIVWTPSGDRFEIAEDHDEWQGFVHDVALLLDAMTEGEYTRE